MWETGRAEHRRWMDRWMGCNDVCMCCVPLNGAKREPTKGGKTPELPLSPPASFLFCVCGRALCLASGPDRMVTGGGATLGESELNGIEVTAELFFQQSPGQRQSPERGKKKRHRPHRAPLPRTLIRCVGTDRSLLFVCWLFLKLFLISCRA